MTDPTDAHTERLRRALEDVRRQLTGHINDTIDELQNALTHVSASRVPLSSKLAEVALAELVESDQNATVRPALVIATTAEFHDITTDELTGPTRTKTVAQARQMAMWLCRDLTDLSLPRIGAKFDRDHTTVMHAIRKIQHDADTNPTVAQQLADLTTLIRRQAAMTALRGARGSNTRTKGAA